MALNKVMLIGNVGNDPDIRYLDSNPQGPQGNAKVASFRLATTERYRDRNGETRENTEWHNIVAWRSNADVIEKFVKKGSQLYVEGKLRTRKWTDRDGKERYTTEIQVDNLQLLGRRPDREGDGQGGKPPGRPGGPCRAPATAAGRRPPPPPARPASSPPPPPRPSRPPPPPPQRAPARPPPGPPSAPPGAPSPRPAPAPPPAVRALPFGSGPVFHGLGRHSILVLFCFSLGAKGISSKWVCTG